MAEAFSARGEFNPPTSIKQTEDVSLLLTQSYQAETGHGPSQVTNDQATYSDGITKLQIAATRDRFRKGEFHTPGQNPGTLVSVAVGPNLDHAGPRQLSERPSSVQQWRVPGIPWPPSPSEADNYNTVIATITTQALAGYAAVNNY